MRSKEGMSVLKVPGASQSSTHRRGKRNEVFILNPLVDSRWNEFIARHPNASIFHCEGWLRTLQDTYGYKPIVITTSKPEESLSNGIVFCSVDSWVTGSRLVSLPFSDHCEPLLSGEPDELEALTHALQRLAQENNFNYIELRPLSPMADEFQKNGQFTRCYSHCIHQLTLDCDLDQLFKNFHKNCVQRNIRKAERLGLVYEEGRSEELLAKFYKLLLKTRRRHQIPPQSVRWFRNLSRCLGDQIKFRVVSSRNEPMAAIITCRYRNTMVYKYGCSDVRAHKRGVMSLLLWRAIQDAKEDGALWFDFGRSNNKNDGLIAFKDHWGGTRSPLPYLRYSIDSKTHESPWTHWVLGKTCKLLPDPLLESLGSFLYKHAG
jgi:hypothetical protein